MAGPAGSFTARLSGPALERTIDDTVLREIQAQLDAEEVRLLGPTSEDAP